MNGFNGIIGNDLIKQQLVSAIASKTIRHAYMITGEKGMGKKTVAEAFLLELFCAQHDHVNGPCLKCPECKKILSGNHPDVIYVTHEKPATISVDEIRDQIMDSVDIRPYAGGYKVYVVPDAEKMTPQAQNALLKTLEEPPEYVVILLLVSDDKQLLDTVRSRVVRESLRPVTDQAIRSYIEEELHESGEIVDICVAFSKGNLGKAVELVKSESFIEWYQRIMKILRNIKGMSSTEIRAEIAKLQSECPDLMEALDLLELWYRDLIMYMVTRNLNGLSFKGERKALMNMASVSSYQGVEIIMEAIEVCRERLRANVNPELSLELMMLRMKEN